MSTIVNGASSRSALIAYGTETGNAQDAAEEIGRLCERLRFKTHVLELDLISLVRIASASESRQLLRDVLIVE